MFPSGVLVISFTASELSLLEDLEKRLQIDVSLSLLAELECELLRLRTDLSPPEWLHFCDSFSRRNLFHLLNLGPSGKRYRPHTSTAPSDALELIAADEFQTRPFCRPSPAQIVRAWEYSLPFSRSARARRAYFAREIAEVVRTMVAPRILILGGYLREVEDALHNASLSQVQLLLVTSDPVSIAISGLPLHQDQLRIEIGEWSHFPRMRNRLGEFDLIYSPGWLDCCDDQQAAVWLTAGASLLRSGGRLLAANFAPDSRDTGWMEACWGWQPFYRSEQELVELAMCLKASAVRGHTICRDESGASTFLEIYSA